MKFGSLPVWKRILVFAAGFIASVSMIDYFAMEKARASGLDLAMSSPFMQTYIFSFWTLFLISAIGFGLFYYWFVRKDKSEAFAITLVIWILQSFGLEDLLYYLLRFTWMPVHLDYLDSHFIIGRISSILGWSFVSPFTLLFSTALGITIAYYLSKKLWRI